MAIDKKGADAAIKFTMAAQEKGDRFIKEFGVQQIIEAYENGKEQTYKWQYYVEKTALYCQDNTGNDDQLQGIFVTEETALTLCKILNQARREEVRYEQE